MNSNFTECWVEQINVTVVYRGISEFDLSTARKQRFNNMFNILDIYFCLVTGSLQQGR
jgi:hypothetical protein